jgi:aminomethyltransferase
MIVTSSGPRKKTARWIMDYSEGSSAFATDVTAAIALPVVQGPRSREFLKSVIEGADLDTLKYFRFVPVRINETEVILSRSGYTGELGYELYTPAEEAGVLWEFLVNAGKAFGLKPYGVTAMQTLRLEKAYPLYGNDINEDVTPFHVGLDRWIRFDKREFIGRDALLRIQEAGIDERFSGLVIDGDMPANVRDPIYPAREVNLYRDEKEYGPEAGNPEDKAFPGAQQVGYITYSNRAPTVGKTLALGYLRTTHNFPGAKMVIRTNGRWIPATVTQTPFFDPGGVRLRA